MKYATQTDGKSSRRKMHTGFLPVISAVILCVAGICLMRRRNMGTVGEERVMQREELAVQKEASLKEKEKEYIEFEKLFRENEDDLQKFIEMSQDIWKEGKYIILFDESEYLRSGMQSAYRQEGLTVILYDNDIITVVENEKAEEKIRSRYDKALALIPRLVEVCDVLHIYDNTKEPFRIFKKRKDKYYHWNNQYWGNDDIERLSGIAEYVN